MAQDRRRGFGRYAGALVAWIGVMTAAGVAAAQEEPELEPLVPPGGERVEPVEEPTPPAPSAPQGTRQVISFRFGASYHILDRPLDAVGDDTILAGSAYTGPGFLIGASYTVWDILPNLGLEIGVLYVHATASGFEKTADYARELLLGADILRVPWSGKYRYAVHDVLRLVGGVGFDIGIGLQTAAEVREQNVPAREQLFLQTRSATTLELSAVAGVEVDVGQVLLPLEVRFSVNPFVGDTTKDRFENYVSPENRGQYLVEFNYTTLFMLGVAYGL